MEDRETILKDFGANIRRIRKAKKLTQLDVEVSSGIDMGEISRYENGKQSMELITIYKFAEALGVSPDELFRFPEKKENGAVNTQKKRPRER